MKYNRNNLCKNFKSKSNVFKYREAESENSSTLVGDVPLLEDPQSNKEQKKRMKTR